MRRAIISFIFLFGYLNVYNQTISESRITNWQICGYTGDIPCGNNLVNVVEHFGANNLGNTDQTNLINYALQNIKDHEILYFPKGKYLFNGTLNIPKNRIIRGESPTETILNFDFNSNQTCIRVKGSDTKDISEVIQISSRNNFELKVSDISKFKNGDDIELYQENNDSIHGLVSTTHLVSWAQNIKGQTAQIQEIIGDKIILDRSLLYDYDDRFKIFIKKINMIDEVGIENLKIKRISNNGLDENNNNIWFTYTKNCWIKSVHSEFTSRYHFRIDFSRNIEVTECFLDRAFDCGGGGAGYGVLIQDKVTECLIENNIANALRHPWIAKEGAARNVYAYNFSNGTTQGSNCDADPLTNSFADISLHGHYASYNLFEGNVVYRITSSDAWGPSGPGNTFFRNRIKGKKGVWFTAHSHSHNFIANELTYPDADFELNRDGTIQNTLNFGNSVNNKTIDDKIIENIPSSLYLNFSPDFFEGSIWPNIGSDIPYNSDKIPAEKRFLNGEIFSNKFNCLVTNTFKKNIQLLKIYPNPTNNSLINIEQTQPYTSLLIKIYDSVGRIIMHLEKVNEKIVQIKLPNINGMYLIEIQYDENLEIHKVIVNN